jgi:hypothetical protein
LLCRLRNNFQKNQALDVGFGLGYYVDPELPAFQPYEVTEAKITIDELAQKLEVDSMLLRYFNACPDNCRLAAGDWLIIPYPK